jgi:hypothetical protein
MYCTLSVYVQVAIPATLGLLAFDRIALRGAVVESSARLLVPNYKEKIVRHEAGESLYTFAVYYGFTIEIYLYTYMVLCFILTRLTL